MACLKSASFLLTLLYTALVTSSTLADELNKKLPGFAGYAVIRIHDTPSPPQQIIFEFGSSEGVQAKLYRSSPTSFTFSVKDTQGKIYTLDSPVGDNGIPIGEFIVLFCEAGIDDNSTSLRVLVNENEVGRKIFPFAINMGSRQWKITTIGDSDIFEIGAWAATFTPEEISKLVQNVPSGVVVVNRKPQLIRKLTPAILGLLISFLSALFASIYLRGRVVEDRVNRTMKGAREIEDIQVLEKEKWRLKIFNTANVLVAVISAMAAALVTYLYFSEHSRLSNVGDGYGVFDPIPYAHAQNVSDTPRVGATAIIQPLLQYMLSAILFAMLAVFVTAAISTLVLSDTPENAGRRTAANDIVKTFGGFFIGVLTSFLKQAIGA